MSPHAAGTHAFEHASVVDRVAVVARLARPELPVAAHLVRAVELAQLVVAVVRPVVALLRAAEHPVAAHRHLDHAHLAVAHQPDVARVERQARAPEAAVRAPALRHLRRARVALADARRRHRRPAVRRPLRVRRRLAWIAGRAHRRRRHRRRGRRRRRHRHRHRPAEVPVRPLPDGARERQQRRKNDVYRQINANHDPTLQARPASVNAQGRHRSASTCPKGHPRDRPEPRMGPTSPTRGREPSAHAPRRVLVADRRRTGATPFSTIPSSLSGSHRYTAIAPSG
jgi:hypothetical protein